MYNKEKAQIYRDLHKEEIRLYNKNWRDNHRLYIREYNREYNKQWRKENGYHNELNSIKRYPEKEQARKILREALRKGEIKKEPCKVCKEPRSQAHHEYYSKPLEIIWLCPLHHREVDEKLRQKLSPIIHQK